MHDALTDIIHLEQLDAEFRAILRQGLDLDTRFLVGDAAAAVRGRDIVIGDRERCIGPADRTPVQAQPLEGLRARHLMHEVAIDIDQTGAIFLGFDKMGIPDFVEQCSRLRHDFRLSLRKTPRARMLRGVASITSVHLPARNAYSDLAPRRVMPRPVVRSVMRARLRVRPRR